MQLAIRLTGKLVIPTKEYRPFLQSFVYGLFGSMGAPEYIVYSSLIGLETQQKNLVSNGDVWLYLASPDTSAMTFVESFCYTFKETKKELQFAYQTVCITSVQSEQTVIRDTMTVKAISGINLSKTVKQKQTRAVSSLDVDYPERLLVNHAKKYARYHGTDTQETIENLKQDAVIKVLEGHQSESFFIKGKTFKYGAFATLELTMPLEFMELAFDAGLGSATSWGFGLIREVN